MFLALTEVAQRSRSEPGTTPSPPIQVFKLREQNRRREPLAVDAAFVRKRNQPVHTRQPGKVKNRQTSATLHQTSISTPGTTSNTGTTAGSITSSISTVPTLTTGSTISGISTIPTFTITITGPIATTARSTLNSDSTVATPTPTFTVSNVTTAGSTTSGATAIPILTRTLPVTITQTEIIVPQFTVTTAITSGFTLVTQTLSPGVAFPQQSPPPSDETPTGPGPGVWVTTLTITQSHSHRSIGTSRNLSGITSASTSLTPGSVNARSALTTQHHASTIAGSVFGGTVALLILFVLFYRRRKRNRATGPILMADPFRSPAEQQQGDATDPTIPSAFTGPISGASYSQAFSSLKSRKNRRQLGDSGVPTATISTTRSPPSTSAQVSLVTMADLNTLRARILEVENFGLRQRIADVENMARAGPSNAVGSPENENLPQIPLASEFPPEYLAIC